MIQGHVGVTSWRFESSLRHLEINNLATTGLPRSERAAGQLATLNGATREIQGLLRDMHANPKRFLTIQLKLF